MRQRQQGDALDLTVGNLGRNNLGELVVVLQLQAGDVKAGHRDGLSKRMRHVLTVW